MANPMSSLLLLFVVAFVVTGAVLSVAVPTLPLVGLPVGPWVVPVIGLVCYVAIFFVGRYRVLPETVTRSAATALTVLTVWIAVTVAATVAAVWMVRLQVSPRFGGAYAIVTIWFGCFFLSGRLLHRLVGGSRSST